MKDKNIDQEIVSVIARAISLIHTELEDNKHEKDCALRYAVGKVMVYLDKALELLSKKYDKKELDFRYVKTGLIGIDSLLHVLTVDLRAVIQFVITSSFRENNDFIGFIWSALVHIDRAKLAIEVHDHIETLQQDMQQEDTSSITYANSALKKLIVH